MHAVRPVLPVSYEYRQKTIWCYCQLAFTFTKGQAEFSTSAKDLSSAGSISNFVVAKYIYRQIVTWLFEYPSMKLVTVILRFLSNLHRRSVCINSSKENCYLHWTGKGRWRAKLLTVFANFCEDFQKKVKCNYWNDATNNGHTSRNLYTSFFLVIWLLRWVRYGASEPNFTTQPRGPTRITHFFTTNESHFHTRSRISY